MRGGWAAVLFAAGCAPPDPVGPVGPVGPETGGATDSASPPTTTTAFEETLLGTLVHVPAGSFTMGSTDTATGAEGDEAPVQQVTLSSYWILRAEVTRAQVMEVVGADPSTLPACPECAAASLSWDEAELFAQSVAALTGEPWRLPTEAEWEYAARGGEDLPYAGSDDAAAVAWTFDNAGGVAHPPCELAPNALGLCDASGNVFEWCSDWYGPYTGSAQVNPTGPAEGTERVVRGGSWQGSALDSRVSGRGRYPEAYADEGVGVRLVRDEIE